MPVIFFHSMLIDFINLENPSWRIKTFTYIVFNIFLGRQHVAGIFGKFNLLLAFFLYHSLTFKQLFHIFCVGNWKLVLIYHEYPICGEVVAECLVCQCHLSPARCCSWDFSVTQVAYDSSCCPEDLCIYQLGLKILPKERLRDGLWGSA